jgi:hypothetical protein
MHKYNFSDSRPSSSFTRGNQHGQAIETQTNLQERKKQRQDPQRTWHLLTIALVIVALHGIFATYLYYTLRTQEAYLERPWILGLMVVHSALNVVAAVGIWYWKKWALYVYAVSP